MKLYNTLNRRLEEFKPISEGEVEIYSCGPTVYWNQHIGHMYAYTNWDCLVRSLIYLGYKVKWVMNITDVGHMVSDEDVGEDKMEKGAEREGVSVWQIADKYIAQFKESLTLLNITLPDIMCRATEHIAEQIELIKKIEANGFTYKTKTGLVFDTSKFLEYANFAKLNLQEQNAGARVEVDPEKKKPWDFLLWVTNQPNHVMQWDSPWGKGFPGWHIECTAMSTKYLGEQFDIHTGGKEHIPVHHTNEIAQSYGAFGRQTANYWLHNEWLMFDNKKISKSLGNSILVSDLQEKGYSPLVMRYLIMTSHYRTGLNFTWESLKGAQTALNRLYDVSQKLRQQCHSGLEPESIKINNHIDSRYPDVHRDSGMTSVKAISRGGCDWERRFKEAIENDLNMPQAIALVWELVKSDLEDKEKYSLLLDWDKVLGLKLDEVGSEKWEAGREVRVGDEIIKLADERERLRKEKKWGEADGIRKKIEEMGWTVEDTEEGYTIRRLGISL